jgi:hypothetical protein
MNNFVKCRHLHTKTTDDTIISYGGIFNTRQHVKIVRCKDCGKIVRRTIQSTLKEPNHWGRNLVGTFYRKYKMDSKGKRTPYYTCHHQPLPARII